MVINNEKLTLKDVLKEKDIYIAGNLKTRQEILKFGSQNIYPYIENICSLKVLYNKLKEVDRLNMVLESGLFLPHAKFSEIDNIYSILIISPQGVKDDKSNIDIYVSFLFLSPLKPSFFQIHLNLLSYVAGIFKKEFIDVLKGYSSPLEVYKIITALEK